VSARRFTEAAYDLSILAVDRGQTNKKPTVARRQWVRNPTQTSTRRLPREQQRQQSQQAKVAIHYPQLVAGRGPEVKRGVANIKTVDREAGRRRAAQMAYQEALLGEIQGSSANPFLSKIHTDYYH